MRGEIAPTVAVAAFALAVGAASVLLTGAAGGDDGPRSLLPQALPAADESDGGDGRFDGRLYADPETGCLTLRPPTERDERRRGWILGAAPDDRSRSVQAAPSEQVWEYPDVERGPWPVCPHAPHDAGSGTD